MKARTRSASGGVLAKAAGVSKSHLGSVGKGDNVVGPGSYQYGFDDGHHQSAPRWTMRSRTTDTYGNNPNPGPGTYEPKTLGLKGPQFSLRPKVYPPDGLNPAGVPGPGTYDPAFKEKGGPKYTLRPKTSGADGHKVVPGPGAYDPVIQPVAHKNPAWSIGREERGKLQGDALAPGPGAYDSRSQLRATGTTFPRDERNKNHSANKQMPGPGQYKLETLTEEAMRTSKGKTFGVKSELKHTNAGPSPGDYDQDVAAIRPKAAKFGFGSSTRDHGNQASLTPAPGTYDVKVEFVKQSGARWGMGSAPQRQEEVTSSKLNPGPEPKFSFGLKPAGSKEAKMVPGPGAYDPELNLAREKAPGYKIGTEERSSLGGAGLTPGPGQYFDPNKHSLSRVGSSFPKAERIGKLRASQTPGPGNYDVVLSKNASGKTIAARWSTNNSPTSVGPGAYDPKLDWSRPQQAAYTMRIRTGEMYEASKNPGPGQYDLHFSKTSPAWRLGTAPQRTLLNPSGSSEAPGPGSYEVSSSRKKFKVGIFDNQFAYGVKVSASVLSNAPGPGQYDPGLKYARESAPSFKVGTETRNKSNSDRLLAPGPGQYDVRSKLNSMGSTFGTSKRSASKGSTGPGPGFYNLPKVTGHMANYYSQGAKIPSSD